jgi:TMEM189-like protein
LSYPLTPDPAHSGNSVSQISHNTAVPMRLPPAPGYSGIVDASGVLHSVVEHVMTYAFGVLCVVNFYLAVREFGWATLIAATIVAGPIAWVLADFVSGLIHWFADTYGSENTPLFGPWLIKPFRQHHLYPRDICTHPLVLTIGNSSTIAMPLESALLYLMLSDEEITLTQALVAFVLNLFAMAMVATNLFHRWAHAEKTSWLILRLQRSGLLLSPAHHDLHHTRPFDCNYCITNGVLNPVLEKARFFRRAESMLSNVGVKPNAGEYQPARPASDLSS